jgi:hypothetical protein
MLVFMFFSFFRVACLGIQIFVGIGVNSRLCIVIFDVFLVFSYLMWTAYCLHERFCGTGVSGAMPASILCGAMYSAAAC